MAVDVAPEYLVRWPTARTYVRGADLGHASFDQTVLSPSRDLTSTIYKRGDNK